MNRIPNWLKWLGVALVVALMGAAVLAGRPPAPPPRGPPRPASPPAVPGGKMKPAAPFRRTVGAEPPPT